MGQAAQSGDQVQPQARQVPGMGGAVPILGPPGQLVGQPGLADPCLPPTSATSGSPTAARANWSRSHASSWARPTNRPAVI